MRNIKTEGIVIKRRNFNEADRLVTVFTKDLGKLQVKAKGVRRITSRRSSHIELLNQSEMSLYKATHLPVLVEVQMINSFSEIKHDLQKMGFAYHLCELIDGLLPDEQEHKEIYQLFLSTLHQIGESQGEEVFFLMHDFEIELLTKLGFWHGRPETSRTLDTHRFIEEILERKLKSHKIFSKLS